MMDTNQILERLDQSVSQLATAPSAPEAFKVLHQALPLIAPRAAILIVRGDRLKGWNAWGYPDVVARNLRTFSQEIAAEDRAAWSSGSLVIQPAPHADLQFGQGPAGERALLPLCVKGQPIALLVAERSGDEQPWAPRLLSVLRTVAQIQLEAALLRRRDRPTSEAPAARPPAPATPTAAAPAPPVAAPAAEETGLAAVAEATAVDPEDNPRLDAARRFARLVATDIRLYNEEAVLQGRRHRDLAERLSEHLHRGKETFLQRHGALGDEGLDILRDAFVQVLAGGDANLLPEAALKQ